VLDDLFDHEKEETPTPLYYALGGNFTLFETRGLTHAQVCQPTQYDLNPVVYVRSNRPLKESVYKEDGAPLKLADYYAETEVKLGVAVTPDLEFCPSKELYSKHQEAHENFMKAIKQLEDLDPELQKKFWEHIDSFMAE